MMGDVAESSPGSIGCLAGREAAPGRVLLLHRLEREVEAHLFVDVRSMGFRAEEHPKVIARDVDQAHGWC